jgi:hypothetical protein
MLRQALLSGSPSPALKAPEMLRQFESALAKPAPQQAPEPLAQPAPASTKRLPVPAKLARKKRARKAMVLKASVLKPKIPRPSASENLQLEPAQWAARQPVPVDD